MNPVARVVHRLSLMHQMPYKHTRRARKREAGEHHLHFNNTGRGLLRVPGFHGLRVPVEHVPENRFATGFGDWTQRRLTAREVAMLRLMNTITDRDGWTVGVRDPDVVARWEEEFKEDGDGLISEAAWAWCVKELRDKAACSEERRLTHVFDGCARLCKSDDLLSEQLLRKLEAEVEGFASSAAVAEMNRGRPADETMVSLVDPDLYPLVFEETRVLSDGGTVGCINAVDQMGRGCPAPVQKWSCSRTPDGRCDGRNPMREAEARGGASAGRGRGRGWGGRGGCTVCRNESSAYENVWQQRAFMFSRRYQWLPSEVRFGPSPVTRTTGMALTSYVNNLHPREYASLYRSIEKIIEASVQPWDEVLVRPGKGRTPPRIRSYGVEWSPPPPNATDLEQLDEIIQAGQGETYEKTKAWLDEFFARPDNPLAPEPCARYPAIEGDWAEKYSPSQALKLKYHRCKEWLHAEPGVSFSYEEWQEGSTGRAVVPRRPVSLTPPRLAVEPSGCEDHESYAVALEEEFAARGLQVVIHIGAVELTPATPVRAATDWQLPGLLNEHIVATTLVYFGSNNVTTNSGAVSFQVEADLDPLAHVWGTDAGSNPHHGLAPLASVYGLPDGPLALSGAGDDNYPGAPALQHLGTVAAPDGRLIASPAVMQHRVEEFQLQDATRPGRRRFLQIHLIDPNYRLCSTRNVPPQQRDWWTKAGWDRMGWGKRGVPPELVRMVEENLVDGGWEEWPLGMAEAERRREEMRTERKRKQEQVFAEEVEAYHFGSFAAMGQKCLS